MAAESTKIWIVERGFFHDASHGLVPCAGPKAALECARGWVAEEEGEGELQPDGSGGYHWDDGLHYVDVRELSVTPEIEDAAAEAVDLAR